MSSKVFENRKTVLGNYQYFFLTFLLKILLDISYANIIVPLYGYSGFKMNMSVSSMCVGWIIFIVSCIFNKPNYENTNSKLSSEVLNLIYIMAFIPFTVMVSFGGVSSYFIVLNLVFWICLFLFVPVRVSFGKKYAIKRQGFVLSEDFINVILLASMLIVIYISGRYTGFRLNFNLLAVYELRTDASNFNMPIILVYLFGATKAINTILIAYYYKKRRYFLVILCFVVQMFSFGIDGSKSVFFYAICAMLINILPRVTVKKINTITLLGFNVITGISLFIFFIFDNYIVSSIFVRRVMFLPVKLEELYCDFFRYHTPDFYRGSFMRFFGFSSPYNGIAKMIGSVYFNNPSMGANSGLVSDGMANLGYAGLILVPLLLVVVLHILDDCANGLDVKIYVATALYISTIFVNSFLFTGLLTHGIIMIMIMLKLMKRNDECCGEVITGEKSTIK